MHTAKCANTRFLRHTIVEKIRAAQFVIDLRQGPSQLRSVLYNEVPAARGGRQVAQHGVAEAMQAQVIFPIRKQDEGRAMWLTIAEEYRAPAYLEKRVMESSQAARLGSIEDCCQLSRICDPPLQLDLAP